MITHAAQLINQQSGSQRADMLKHPELQQFVVGLVNLIEGQLHMYDARGLANLLWALSSFGEAFTPSKGWLARFTDVSQPMLPKFNAQQLSNTLWAFARLGYIPRDTWIRCFLDASMDQFEQSSVQCLSNMLWALAQLQSKPPEHWVQSLLQEAALKLHRGSDQAMSNLLWACAKLGYPPPAVFYSALQQWLQQRESQGALQAQLGQQATSNAFWALATLQQRPRSATWGSSNGSTQSHQLASSSQYSTNGLNASSSSTVCVDSSHSSRDSCLQLLLQGSEGRLHSFSNQQLSNTAWALAVLQRQPSAAWSKQLFKVVTKRFSTLNGQQVSNLLWAIAHLQLSPPQGWVDRLLLGTCHDTLPQFSSVALCGVLVALARLRHTPDSPWLQRLLGELQRRNYGSAPRAMSECLCALAGLQYRPHEDWLSGYLTATQSRLHAFSARQLASIAWALLKLSVTPSSYWVGAWHAEVVSKATTMDQQSVAMCLWASMHFGCKWKEQQLQQVMACTMKQLSEGKHSTQSLAMMAWSAAKLQPVSSREAALHIVNAAIPNLKSSNAADVSQLLQAAALCRVPLTQMSAKAYLRHVMHLARRQQLQPRDWSAIACSVARLRLKPSRNWLFTLVTNFNLAASGRREACNVLWALAVMRHHPGVLWMKRFVRRTAKLMPGFTPADIVSCSWALASIGYRPPSAWQQMLVDACKYKLGLFRPHELALLLWSLAKLQCVVSKDWKLRAAAEVCRLMHTWKADDLAMGVWGFAELDGGAVLSPEAWELISTGVTSVPDKVLGQLKPRQLVMVLHGVARLQQSAGHMSAPHGQHAASRRHRIPPIDQHWLQLVLCRIKSQLGSLPTSQVATVWESIARLGCRPPTEWQEGMLQDMLLQTKRYPLQHVSRIVKAMAILQSPVYEQWKQHAGVVYRPGPHCVRHRRRRPPAAVTSTFMRQRARAMQQQHNILHEARLLQFSHKQQGRSIHNSQRSNSSNSSSTSSSSSNSPLKAWNSTSAVNGSSSSTQHQHEYDSVGSSRAVLTVDGKLVVFTNGASTAHYSQEDWPVGDSCNDGIQAVPSAGSSSTAEASSTAADMSAAPNMLMTSITAGVCHFTNVLPLHSCHWALTGLQQSHHSQAALVYEEAWIHR